MTEQKQNSLDLVRAAAERGVREAQSMYGQMLLDGKLVKQNQAYALHWFERAAAAGDVMAINMVGRCIDQGWGVARSPRLAMKWFRKAADLGSEWGMYNLATLLTLGEDGVPKDRTMALQLFRQAAEMGHVKSINIIGGFYEDGWEVEQSREKARECYQTAAKGGDFRGKFNYARMLVEEGDVLGALYWLKQVPETATPAFLQKMRDFLMKSPVSALREFAGTIDVDSQHAVVSAMSEPTAAGATV